MTPARARASNPVDLSFLGGLWIYRNVISPVDGTRCGMYPTCSAFATEAIRKHGFLLGGMLAADRLLHESSARPPAYPIVRKFGRDRISDPVENNDRLFRHASATSTPPPAMTLGESVGVASIGEADLDAATASGVAFRLAAAGRPYAAVTEFRRAAYLDSAAPERAAESLIAGGWVAAHAAKETASEDRATAAWEDADRLFDDAERDATVARAEGVARRAAFGRATAYLARGYAREAQRRYAALASGTAGQGERTGAIRPPADGEVGADDAAFLSAWAGMEADLADGVSPRNAARHFEGVPGAHAAFTELSHERLSWRSPRVAAALSAVIPGAGFAWAGRPLIGAGSFLLNGVFLAGIYFAARDHNLPLAGALLSLEAGWYVGGVTGSAESALRRNDATRRSFSSKARRRFLGSVGPGGVAAGLLF